MSIILFIAILAVLIIVHEYGHFFVAKKGGIRVDEFGLGYPPRAKTLFRRNGTDFTLNWLPFGGFVKIFGENPDDESLEGLQKNSAFVNKPRWIQALVLFAGPFMNFLFAWVIILATLLTGMPTTLDESFNARFIKDESILITEVRPNSPADVAGLHAGYKVTEIKIAEKSFANISGEDLHNLVLENPKGEFEIFYTESGSTEIKSAKLESAEIEGEQLLGLALSRFGIYKPNLGHAFIDSFKFTGSMIANITLALGSLVKGLFVGGADLSSLTGPIGIVGLVGQASREGVAYILSFIAIISINLGIINLIPFPALDGGRLLFLLIEKIKGGRVNHKIMNTLNTVGFSLLILLMVFVSYRDILRLF